MKGATVQQCRVLPVQQWREGATYGVYFGSCVDRTDCFHVKSFDIGDQAHLGVVRH